MANLYESGEEIEMSGTYCLLARDDAKPSADYSAWVIPASKEAGAAAENDEVFVHGRSWSLDPVLVALWVACCVAFGLWGVL
jgi:hypothetical protein